MRRDTPDLELCWIDHTGKPTIFPVSGLIVVTLPIRRVAISLREFARTVLPTVVRDELRHRRWRALERLDRLYRSTHPR